MATALSQIGTALQIEEERLHHLVTLSEEHLAAFAHVIAKAIETQTADIEASFEHVLRLAPGPLRGAVRKMLFPGGSRG